MIEPAEEQTVNNDLPNPSAEMVAHPTQELTTKEAYFASLREWAKLAYIAQNTMPIWYYPVGTWPMNMAPVAPPTPQPDPHPDGRLPVSLLMNVGGNIREPVRSPNSRTLGGFQYSVAPITKRFWAEVIDILVSLFVKLLLIMLLNFFETEFVRKKMRIAVEGDFAAAFTSTFSNLFITDLIVTLLLCWFEAAWTSVTPGNYFMQIRVLKKKRLMYMHGGYEPDFEDFVTFQIHQPLPVLIFPIETPSVLRMFVRALIKHIIFRAIFDRLLLVLFLPITAVVMFFKFNRCIHDVVTSTIVVENRLYTSYRLQTPAAEQQQ